MEEVRQEREEGVRQGRREEVRQSGRRRKGGGRRTGSAPRTKLEMMGCNSSDLKTIVY